LNQRITLSMRPLVILADEQFADGDVLISELVDGPIPVVDRLVDEYTASAVGAE
jgi:hypothetical protein